MNRPPPTPSHEDAHVALRHAARALGLAVPEEDLEPMLAHLMILRGFANGLDDPAAEPAPVFVP